MLLRGDYLNRAVMTEVSSMSETEGRRPSSLPPPPSERLPQPPQIFISDTEECRHKRKACRKVKKHNTVSGVTLEARRVLEHLLRRSLSDAPQHSDSSGGGNSDILSRHGKAAHATYTSRDFIPGELSHQNITDRMMKEKMNQLEMSLSESHDEPDYVYTHELVRRPLSISSQGSGKHVHGPSSLASSQGPVPFSQGSLSGSQGSSTKHLHQSPKSLRLGGQTTQCSSTKHGHVTLYHDDEDVSSSSTEDYEYTDPNEFLRRKKKSFFRRHTERLMHTFRRRKQRPLDLTELECCQDDHSPQKCMKKKRKGHKLASPFKSLRGTKSSAEQDASECIHVRESRRECIHQEVLRTASSSPEHVTHYTDIEQFHEESLRRKCTSPLSWKRGHKGHKDGHLSDGGKDKGLLDSFIRTIKKRSSFRTKKKKVPTATLR